MRGAHDLLGEIETLIAKPVDSGWYLAGVREVSHDKSILTLAADMQYFRVTIERIPDRQQTEGDLYDLRNGP